MSESHTTEVSQFCLEGRFLDFVIKDGYKLKGLLIGTNDGEFYVKLAKNLRFAFDLRLPPGTWLQIVGQKKHEVESGKVTLKAERVMAASPEVGRVQAITQSKEVPSINNTKAKAPKAKAAILVCQKSDCMKRGGKGLCQALEAALSDRGLEDQVTIKGTGCMKNCKAGPNLIMPDKTRYSRIQATQVPALMDKHFADKSEEQKLNHSQQVTITTASLAINS
ncbi:MAG: (2Fe-2S) ferredoxin domain-containing protein [Mojavia pulchra JT2-VF2]|jgi:NADH:ubiquinone oxidoreductase subunit E|uniref:(2Fe-2S) ferredoxin domain-containing protein n=1 Tax=Mojavia pulchra JT2-VF2 TaxID=287848 RepID=A0A951PUK2_9NOST|nr:(2Fe-2S) ferredoxin domain-containing protein [Mojavia pulchra JT2-VF2]